MKSIYFLFVLLLTTTAFAASWGSVDFRILESEDLVFPLVIEFENYRGEDLQADLIVETVSPEANFGPSEIVKSITIAKDPELLYLDFPVTKEERLYDVWVSVYVNDELAEQMYNSLIRVKPGIIEDELPLLPGEQMDRSLMEDDYMAEVYEKYPNFDELPLNEQIELMMNAQAEAAGLSEKEYLERLGSDAESIDELTHPSEEKINEINQQYLKDERARSYQVPLIVGSVAVLTLLLIAGAIWLLRR